MSIFYLKPDTDKQFFLLGTIFKEENNLKNAINYFNEAIKNNFNNYKALFELATTSDTYYKDKKIALKHFKKYFEHFESKDQEMTVYAKNRIKEIKKQFFIEGEIVE